MKTVFKTIFLFIVFLSVTKGHLHLDWEPTNPAFDPNFYKDLLDPELCQDQLRYLVLYDPWLLLQFTESGLRIPRGITEGNLEDWGIYHSCLGISVDIHDSIIEGKHCFVNVPTNQTLDINLPRQINFNPNKLIVEEKYEQYINQYNNLVNGINALTGNTVSRTGTNQLQELTFKLSVCIPKPCTTQDALNSLYNFTALGFQYEDIYCRVKHDKLWAPADYVAIAIFSFLGLLTLLSTSYDVFHTVLFKTDPKRVKPICKAFSLYTNTRRLLTFTKNPSALECVDGIRALAMAWVIVGHTFTTLPQRQNLMDVLDWTVSLKSLWISAGPISVDTFFMLSGMLLVYTSVGKMTRMKLLRNLHSFYLNRLFRMFPLLAAGVLLQASIFLWIADGPVWDTVASNTERCRNYWWSTLLYVQNFVNPERMCLSHSWYLAIDIQLHIMSPLILFWVLSGKKLYAWISMITAFLAFLVSSTVYNFMMDFPGGVITLRRNDDYMYYMVYYYLNTLTRASPFFVGMMFGYLLHLYRDKKVNLTKVTATLIWFITLSLTTLVIYTYHVVKPADWDNQTVDTLINSFTRPVWAAGVGWIIFACHHGYGGPINWLLSLQMWKLPSRLSYGMYIFHYPIMYITSRTAVAPIYFRQSSGVYRFFSEFAIALMVSFAMTVFVDSPFSTLTKLVLGGGPKKPRVEKVNDEKIKANDGQINDRYIRKRSLESRKF